MQNGESQEASNHAGNGQQEAPDAQALVVELQEAQDVAVPPLANHSVSRPDVALAEQWRHFVDLDSWRKGWQGREEVEQQQPRRRREGQRHPGHRGKLQCPVVLPELNP